MAVSIPCVRTLSLVGAAFLAISPALPVIAQTRPASASDVTIPLSDARNIGPNSVRFAAAQHTKDAPTIVIFGVSKANWPKLNAAMQQAVFDGYPIKAIFIGPQNAPPALEIYAKGVNVVRYIDPNTISGPELTRLIRRVHQQHYGR